MDGFRVGAFVSGAACLVNLSSMISTVSPPGTQSHLPITNIHIELSMKLGYIWELNPDITVRLPEKQTEQSWTSDKNVSGTCFINRVCMELYTHRGPQFRLICNKEWGKQLSKFCSTSYSYSNPHTELKIGLISQGMNSMSICTKILSRLYPGEYILW